MPTSDPLAALTAYELRHLTSHLVAGRRAADLHHLLELERADGRNAWFEAKGADSRTGEYAADLAAAWQLARTERDIPRRLRYALMSASVRSRWQHLPARLLSASVGAGLVPWSEALSIIEQIPSVSARANAVEELGPVMPDEGLPFLLDQALALPDLRDGALQTLAPWLPLALVRRALPAVQQEVRRFQDDGAVHGLIFRLAELGEASEALGLFTRYRSVPLAKRLASVVDDQETLFGDDAFLSRVLLADGADTVEPARLGAWARRVLSGPPDLEAARALLASFARMPRDARDLINPIALCAMSGEVRQEVRALVHLAPALDEPARGAALRRAVTLTLDAPASEDSRAFAEIRDEPVRAMLCLEVAPALAECGDRGTALELARLAFDTGLGQREFITYDGDWLGNALVTLAEGAELDEAVRRVVATRDPWLRLHRMLAILPLVTGAHHHVLVPRVRKEIVKLPQNEQAKFLVDLLPWLPMREREDALTTALGVGGLVGRDGLELPRLVGTLPPEARPRFLDRVMATARDLEPTDAAPTLLAIARSSEPDRRAALLLQAVRLHRDALLNGDLEGLPGDWLPLTAEELERLDLREVLGYYQAVGDGQQITDHETGLLRILGGPVTDPSEQERAALAEHYAEAGDLKTALTYSPLTADLLRLAIPATSGEELLKCLPRLSAEDQVQACLDLAWDGPAEILADVAEIARSIGNLHARGEILLAAAGRVPAHSDAVRLGLQAWTLAMEAGIIPDERGVGTTVPWARGSWLGSAAIDVLLPLLPGPERTELLRRTLDAVPSLGIFGHAVLLRLARLGVPELRKPILERAEARDHPEILAAGGDCAAAVSAIERLGGNRCPVIATVAGYLPLELLPRARALIGGRSTDSELAALGAIARRLYVLGEPGQAVALLSELSAERQGFSEHALGAIAYCLCVVGEPGQGVALLSELSAERQGFDEFDAREKATGDLPVLLARHGYFSHALRALRFLPETNGWRETPRLDVLAQMVPELTRGDPASAHQAVFAMMDMRDRGRWLDLLSAYAQVAAERPSEPRWDEMLGRAASMTRAQALGIVRAVRPVTRALGGLTAVEEEARSAGMIRRWWPP